MPVAFPLEQSAAVWYTRGFGTSSLNSIFCHLKGICLIRRTQVSLASLETE